MVIKMALLTLDETNNEEHVYLNVVRASKLSLITAEMLMVQPF